MQVKHIGRSANRLYREPREAVFAESWKRMNSKQMHNRPEVIDWLLHGDGSQCHARATQKEATIAATLVQWLGSPVGFGWLENTLRAAGYEIKEVQDGR